MAGHGRFFPGYGFSFACYGSGFYSILDLACRNKKAGWWQRIEAKVFARGIDKMIHMYFSIKGKDQRVLIVKL